IILFILAILSSFLEPVMHFCVRTSSGGPKAQRQASPGQRPGLTGKKVPSPERAESTLPPFQGWGISIGKPRALPWAGLFATPLVLLLFHQVKCMTGSKTGLSGFAG